ncbi:polyhydroxyalkanoate depolymerase [Paraburkholderia sp. BL10I2N1]|uniref:polyhydroxyalkanoate depolymerase n=1 Tax=Paraburkholderia sp. BL10I2N1 TaxID=1938796 RepID=UPI00105B9EBD|nr:polyhydroxyalkanoate depolymerase [Paraburkholderia sp. BL10I2N1]
MSYPLRELQNAIWAPFLPWLQATASFFTSPDHAPSALPTCQIAAGCDLLVRLCQRYPKPEFGLTDTVVDGQRVAVTETVVVDQPFCRLLHFQRATPHRHPVALVVAPLSGHHATLLRDTVAAMLPDFDIYITDWVDARQVPLSEGTFHLDDYVAYVREFISFLGPEIHVVSVCQSTVPVLAAISLMAAHGEATPRSVTLIGGPIDARRGPTTVNEFALSKPLDWFARELIDTVPGNYPGAGRKVYPGFVQHAAFVAMNPERHLDSHLRYYGDVAAGNSEAADAHRRFYDEYNAVLDMTAEYYLETVRVVFQEFCLARGDWRVRGEHVRPGAIKATALITVEGERDDICGRGQTHAAHDLCTGLDASLRHRLTARGCGHYGIFSGNAWRTAIYPQLRDLIYQHEARASDESAAGLHNEFLEDVAA